ncbi:MAG TPA: UDP-3-O-(3-hydroxymyristoyl)glucosamine N-acyltransferase [Pyrinomonadaceae bacterium]|nr:UDP-3-O-(3-hydroxymyristoyl)glucosamine N-acyltransferase [Pyrinomonadaceae bacterium]
MNEANPRSASALAAEVGGKILGDGSVLIDRVAALETAREGEIAYVEDKKLFETARQTNASCLLVTEEFTSSDENGNEFLKSHQSTVLIQVARPKLAFTLIANLLQPTKKREPSIHATAVIATSADVALTAYVGPHVSIGENARIGAGTRIEAGVVIGDEVAVGIDCVLHPNVTLYDRVTLGDRVVLHAGACIGADGFGYVRDDMSYHKFPQIGTVLIEDDVELGAHSCVDRAALGQTRIGRGTKIDNMVHVGHNCDIGEHVVIAAQTGISGSVVIEDDAVIGGQVGFGDHTRVQKGAVIGSKAGILPGKIVRPGVWWGIPVQPLNEYKRMNAHLGRLPQMREEIKELRERIRQLEEQSKNPD